MVSAYRVVFRTGLTPVLPPGQERTMTVTDQVLGITFTDGVAGQMPQASITLPLKRSTDEFGRLPYTDLLAPGDLCTIEVLASHGRGEDWVTILDGPIRSLSESESLPAGGGLEATTTVEVGSFADVLNEDTVAWWMFYGTVEGYGKVRSYLTPDQLSQSPYRVAFDYLTKIAMTESVYRHFATLADRVSLAFGGLEALTPLELTLTMAEGSFWSVISGFTDAPLHELYVTTMPPDRLPGTLTRAAANPAGSDKGATTVVWRTAPYVHATPAGRVDASAWNALPLHDLTRDGNVVDTRRGTYSKAAIRNFTLVYPAIQFVNEDFAYAHASAIANTRSIRTFGYRPLKFRTHLLTDDSSTTPDIVDFMTAMSYRAAGQWNEQHRLKNAVISAPLTPTVLPGHRVLVPDPWLGEDAWQYHVRARQITLDPVQGARMTLNLERGAPNAMYADPAWLVADLEAVRVGAETYAERFRLQDEPGAPP